MLRDYLKIEVATNDDTIREHSPVAASPSSSLTSSRTSPAALDTSRASPMFVRPPTDAPDSVSALMRRTSPLRYVGYAADIRTMPPFRVRWGCHIPYPDTDAEDSALLGADAGPPRTPVSPSAAWYRVDIRSRHHYAQRSSTRLYEDTALGSRLASVGRVATDCIPPERALPIEASADCHSQHTPPNSSQRD